MRAGYLALAVGFVSAALVAQQPAPRMPATTAVTPARAAEGYGKLPLSFVPNQGQADASVRYLSQGAGYSIALRPGSATFALHQAEPVSRLKAAVPPAARTEVVRMDILGGDAKAAFTPEKPLPGYVNYMRGSTPSKWQIGVPTYAETRVHGVYPGVDLAYYGTQGQLEYDFIVKPGADARTIRLGMQGATPELTKDGELLLKPTEAGAQTLTFHKPVLYQDVNGQRRAVDGAFTLARNGEVGFSAGAYDHAHDLVIDPYIVYGSFFGGTGDSNIYAAALNSSDDLYIGGTTTSTLPGQDASLNVQAGNPDAFVSKISASGSSVLWTTVLGGASNQQIYGLALSATGDVYVTGSTGSQNGLQQNGGNLPGQPNATQSFPITANAFQPLCGPINFDNNDTYTPDAYEISGCSSSAPDAFITHLSSDGKTLVYSTFLGGSNNETGVGIAVDASGNMYVMGVTNSTEYAPTYTDGNGNQSCSIPAYPANLNGVKMNGYADFPTTANGYAQSYTLAEGESNGQGQTPNCFYSYGAGDQIFFTEMAADGQSLLYSTTIGGLNQGGGGNGCCDEYAQALALSPQGIAYVGLQTSSSLLPITGGLTTFKTVCVSPSSGVCSQSAYIAAFDPTKSGAASLVFSTYLVATQPYPLNSQGGNTGPPASALNGLATDSAGNVYIAGSVAASNFPTTAGVFQPSSGCVLDSYGYCSAAFVVKLAPSGATVWSTQYEETPSGTGGSTTAAGIGLDSSDDVYVTGLTTNGTALQNPITTSMSGGCGSIYMIKLNPTASKLIFGSYFPASCYLALASGPLPVDSAGNMYVTGTQTTSNGVQNYFPLSANAFDTSIKHSYAGFVSKIATFDNTVTSLAVSPTTATVGDNINLTATVTNTTGTPVPTGYVQLFENNTTLLGTIPVNASGVAVGSGPSTAFPSGTYNLLAKYLGDGTDLPSSSAEVKLTLNHATAASLTASPTSVKPGASVTATATVTRKDGTGVPTGTVTFYVQTTEIGEAPLSAGGVAKITQATTGVAAGSYPVYAVYSGDTKDGGATSGNVVVTIQ